MDAIAAKLKAAWETAKTQAVRLWRLVAEKAKSLLSAVRSRTSSADQSADDEKRRSPRDKIITGVGLALCIVFAFMLVCNLIIIVKGSVAPDKPPSVLGITPMVVLSGSMSGDAEDHIEIGDLIFVGRADPDKLKEGDVIAFMEGSVTVTHRIVRIETGEDGSVQWITKGDANNTEDQRPVTTDNLVGIYKFRIAGLGNVALFLQQPVGMLICIGIPCLAFIVYDIIRRQRTTVKEGAKASEMETELERLRRLVGEQNAASELPEKQTDVDDSDDESDDFDETDEDDEDDDSDKYDDEFDDDSDA